MEPSSITFVRHGETEANLADVWQGHGDSPLSERGRRQIEALGARLRRRSFGVVVSSDLGRAVETAAVADADVAVDPSWRELDMGEWDGMPRAEIFANYPDLLAELRSGKDVRWGGGETYGEFVTRIDAATERLAAGLGPGEHALVVSHGGVIHAVVAGLLGFRGSPRPWPVGRIANASLTTLEVEPRRLAGFNDAGHLGGDHESRHGGRPVVTLVRHGQTAANVHGWWHGTTDLDLTPEGERQAAAVSKALPPVQALYSSPLQRAQRTAKAIADHHGVAPDIDERLREIDFGDWEGLTGAEISARYPDQWEALATGTDVPLGGTGETLAQVGDRMLAASRAIANGAATAAVTHGGAIRVLLARAIGLSHADRWLLGLAANGSTTSLVFADDRIEIADFNVASHLEG